MTVSKPVLKKAAKRLLDAAKTFHDEVDAVSTPDPIDPDTESSVTSKYAAVAEAFADVQRLMRGDSTSFGGFLSQVGESMVAAQMELDERSKGYIEATLPAEPGGPMLIQPSVFRLPKVSGEFRFALERVASKKLNLVFLSKKEEAREMHQQALQFDIIAAPPPVEALRMVESLHIRLVLRPSERTRLFEVVRTAQLRGEMTEDKIRRDLLLENQNRVLITPGRPHQQAEPPETYFLLFAQGEAATDTGIWHITVGKADSVLDAVRRWAMQAKLGEELFLLHDWIEHVGRKQAKLLGPAT